MPERVEDFDPDDERRIALDLAVQSARRSPGGFMAVTARNRLQYPRHIQVLDDAVTEAATADEGRLIVSVTVRAGKSTLCSRYTPSWYLGTHPDHRVLLAGHEATFAAEHGGFARDLLTEWGPPLFGVAVNPTNRSRSRWSIAGHTGGMLTLGVGGSPIGRGGDLVIVDDPIKGFEQAMNDEARRKINEGWWQGVMESRIEPGGSVIVVCSRWHEDDLSGFLMKHYPGEWKELRIPALCDDPENDPLGRQEGESYWPRRWPRERLLDRQRRTGGESGMVWLAQYQNRPTTPEGKMFPVGKLRPVRRPTDLGGIDWCRGWDLAGTAQEGSNDPDWTATVLLGRYRISGRWLIASAHRFREEGHIVRSTIKTTALADGADVWVELPQDPAQAGKDQAAQIVASLSGFQARAKPQTGDKTTRAAGVSAQVQAGNVDVLLVTDDELHLIVAGVTLPDPEGETPLPDWYTDLIAEMRSFPRGAHDDFVDALSSAFNRLAWFDAAGEGGGAGGDAFDGLLVGGR